MPVDKSPVLCAKSIASAFFRGVDLAGCCCDGEVPLKLKEPQKDFFLSSGCDGASSFSTAAFFSSGFGGGSGDAFFFSTDFGGAGGASAFFADLAGLFVFFSTDFGGGDTIGSTFFSADFGFFSPDFGGGSGSTFFGGGDTAGFFGTGVALFFSTDFGAGGLTALDFVGDGVGERLSGDGS